VHQKQPPPKVMLAFAMLSILATPVSCGKLRALTLLIAYADLDWPIQTLDFHPAFATSQPIAAGIGGGGVDAVL
jgi:hypothetical protein